MPRLLLFPALKRVTLGLLVDFWRTLAQMRSQQVQRLKYDHARDEGGDE
jgi:hypothetical protein